ncbi:MAG: dephospho-CoA kinase [Phycisphaerae bacterium]|nr:dephospho-CoA kinase [Phycisphaerae bacterium]
MAGGIGAGKSTVARIACELGGCVIDSDRIARAEMNDPAVVALMRQWWGDSICRPDGSVDRAWIAETVFRDAAERARLEALIHPRVAVRRRDQMAAARSDPAVRLIVLDSPLLFEAGLAGECDAIVFVDADRGVRRARVQATRGWSEQEFDRREKVQDPLDSKRCRADYVVDGNSELDELRRQVKNLISRILHEEHGTP